MWGTISWCLAARKQISNLPKMSNYSFYLLDTLYIFWMMWIHNCRTRIFFFYLWENYTALFTSSANTVAFNFRLSIDHSLTCCHHLILCQKYKSWVSKHYDRELGGLLQKSLWIVSHLCYENHKWNEGQMPCKKLESLWFFWLNFIDSEYLWNLHVTMLIHCTHSNMPVNQSSESFKWQNSWNSTHNSLHLGVKG